MSSQISTSGECVHKSKMAAPWSFPPFSASSRSSSAAIRSLNVLSRAESLPLFHLLTFDLFIFNVFLFCIECRPEKNWQLICNIVLQSVVCTFTFSFHFRFIFVPSSKTLPRSTSDGSPKFCQGERQAILL